MSDWADAVTYGILGMGGKGMPIPQRTSGITQPYNFFWSHPDGKMVLDKLGVTNPPFEVTDVFETAYDMCININAKLSNGSRVTLKDGVLSFPSDDLVNKIRLLGD